MKNQKSPITKPLCLSQFIISLLVLLLAACNNAPDYSPDFHIIDIRNYSETDINSLLQASELFQLELTEKSILPPSGRIWPGQNGLFFSSTSSNFPYLYYFNEKGEFLSKIGRQGKGPGEYLSCYNFMDLGDTIAVYDQSKKFTLYLRDGTYVGSIYLNQKQITATTIHPSNGDIYLFTGLRNYKVYRVNSKTLVETDSFLFNPVVDESMSNSFYHINQNKLFFQDRGDRRLNIYEFDETIRERYHIETGIDLSNYRDDDPDKNRQFYQPGKEFWMLWGIQENKDWVYFYLRSDSFGNKRSWDLSHFLYCRRNKKVYRLPGHRDSEDVLGVAFRLDSNNTLYLTYNPVQMEESQIWMERLKQLNLEFSLDQNPYVVKVNLDKLFNE